MQHELIKYTNNKYQQFINTKQCKQYKLSIKLVLQTDVHNFALKTRPVWKKLTEKYHQKQKKKNKKKEAEKML